MIDLARQCILERLNLTRWFRYNACARHGVPFNEVEAPPLPEVPEPPKETPPSEIIHRHIHEGLPPGVTAHTPEPRTVPSPPSPTPPAPAPPDTKEILRVAWRQVWPWIAALAAMGLGTGGFTWWLNRPVENTTIIEQPVERDGSLLQYLEDEGRHLPQGERE